MFYYDYLGTLLVLTPLPLFILLGVLWLGYFITFHKEEWKRNKELQKNNRINNRKKRKDNLFARKDTWSKIILFFITMFAVITIIPYWMDFPKFITGNYSITKGIITNEVYFSGKDSHTDIIINNNTYRTYGSDYPPIGSNVVVRYLPNTKLIYKIELKQ